MKKTSVIFDTLLLGWPGRFRSVLRVGGGGGCLAIEETILEEDLVGNHIRHKNY